MTFLIVLTAGFGMFFGYGLIHYDLAQYEAFDLLTGYVIKAGLCTLVFMAGLELGDEGTFLTDFRAAGAKVLMVPAATALGTFAGAAVSSLFLPFSLKQVLAIGAGFGWYSFAPVMIMEKGFVLVSAVSFMHNVMRELLSMLLIPIVAKNLGFIEAVALPGSSSSDICLPLIVKSTRGGIAVYSFMNGISVSILVPILVPLCIG